MTMGTILGATLPEKFYYQSTERIARQLLNAILVHDTETGLMAGRIVECEMYQGPLDKAAHSYAGVPTGRTAVMYGPPGRAYVYLIYGMHYCLNIVTGGVGVPHAILIRAMEPLAGHEEMLMRRRTAKRAWPDYRVLSGPGNLTRALHITKENNGQVLTDPPLYLIAPSRPWAPYEVALGPRINIGYAEEARHFLWRFWIKDHPAVSVAAQAFTRLESPEPLFGVDDTI